MIPVDRFRELHGGPGAFVMPNAWDGGSARILEQLGFPAIATTSSGAAAAAGRLDGALGRDATLAHAAALVAAVGIPVSVDLENGFADDPAGVADTIERAADAGLAGASVEDWSGTAIYDPGAATERVAAAVRAAAGRLVITARAENHIRGIDDLDDTIARLTAFAAAGADVVFAPGVTSEDGIRRLVESVAVPVSVLALPGTPPVARLAQLGVRRVSVGGGLAFAAYGELERLATELRDAGRYGFFDGAAAGRDAISAASER